MARPAFGCLTGLAAGLAVRVEGLAEPGGICVTGQIRDQVSHRVLCRFRPRQGVQLKGITNAPPVFDVVLDDKVGGLGAGEAGVAAGAEPDTLLPRGFKWGFKGLGLYLGLAVMATVIGAALVRFARREPPTTSLGSKLREEVGLGDVATIPGRLAVELLKVLPQKAEVGITQALSRVESPEAYRLCLQGRFHARTGTSQGFTNALECFEKALEVQAGYPMALVGLAHAYLSASDWLLPSTTAFAKAKDHLLLAQSQAETIPDAVYLLAYVRWTGDWNHREAAALFQRAIALDPRHYAGPPRFEAVRRKIGLLDP